jgi:outer membrane protein OmpA-like peptidoglycan-associated protein
LYFNQYHHQQNQLTVAGNMKMKKSSLILTAGAEYLVLALTVMVCFLLLAGCASLPGGSVKTYPSEYHTTVQASSDTLADLKIPVTETVADGLKTTLKAQRPDGTPIVVEVVRISKNSTEVSVRAGSVPFGDERRVANQINEFIHERLDSDETVDPVPEISEENLEERTDQQVAAAAPVADAGKQDWNRSPAKVAEMLHDSIFIIYFGLDSNELSDKAKRKLDRVVEIIRSNSITDITLNGYTDSYGAQSYNEMIAEVRTSMVKAYLVGKGIPADNIQTFGHGAQKFIASNKTLQGRRMNRRVEIELHNYNTP